MPARKHPIGYTRQRILENLISENPKPWSEVAAELGIKPQSLYDTVHRIKRKGSSFNTSLANNVLPPIRATKTSQEDTLQAIESGQVTDPIIRRAKLDHLITTGQPGIALRAIQIREDLDRFSGVRVGPPVPTTHPETVVRLGTILKAAGPKLTKEAIEWAAEQNHKKEEPIAEDQNPVETVSPEPPTGRSDLVG